MKISGPSDIGKPSDSKKKKKIGGDDGTFSRLLGQAVDDTKEVEQIAPPSAADALLALQEISLDEEQQRKGIQSGEDMLACLDALRHGLLTGELPEHQLRRLEVLVKQHRGNTFDPRLQEILDDIELRAAVELAKLERARGM